MRLALLFLLFHSTIRAAPQPPLLPLNGADHWVRIAGRADGPTVIVIHGGPGGTVYDFEHTAGPAIERFARVVYYEQRGCGRSAPDHQPLSLSLLVSDLEALRATQHLGRVVLLAYSFGAELALAYAHRFPQHVARIILEGPSNGDWKSILEYQIAGFQRLASPAERRAIRALFATQPSLLARYDGVWGLVSERTVDRFLFHRPAAARKVRQLWSELGREANDAYRKAFVTASHAAKIPAAVLAAIWVPTLIVTGRYDNNTGLAMSRELARQLRGSVLQEFEQSGHFPHAEQTERFAAVVEVFLSRPAAF